MEVSAANGSLNSRVGSVDSTSGGMMYRAKYPKAKPAKTMDALDCHFFPDFMPQLYAKDSIRAGSDMMTLFITI
ncbi:hypothetical protein MFFC18_12040 [Mariniblastus fucicola]|uniref:Uncharacterized protein n=1 Tax=Mariniblastus fucicola TaxID=980251 RepID=A0A5B9P4N2_9BACT|nr:hypothetical protein MFFC18_12040 [Mariniblastus fucicola]